MPRVREASQADAETISRFQLSMARETEDLGLDEERLAAGVAAVLGDRSRGRYLVVEDDDGTVSGSLLLTHEWSDWRNGWVWWIQSVWVDPARRRRGFYRLLYDHVITEAGSRDEIVGVRLYVDRRNERAQEVYRRLGMDGDHYVVFEAMNL